VTGKNYYDDAPNPKMGLLSIDAGFKFNPYLAAEIRVGTGIKNASHSWTATDKGTSSQKRVIGLYVKGILPINSLFSAYGLVGYTHGTNHFKETDTGYYNSVDTSDSSPSYGIGANINATKQVSVNLEYAHLYNEKAYGVTTKYEALTLGVNYQF
jgi:opacity protein-like surface antigen